MSRDPLQSDDAKFLHEMEESAINRALRESILEKIEAAGERGVTNREIRISLGRNGQERIYGVLRQLVTDGRIDMVRANPHASGTMRLAWVSKAPDPSDAIEYDLESNFIDAEFEEDDDAFA